MTAYKRRDVILLSWDKS